MKDYDFSEVDLAFDKFCIKRRWNPTVMGVEFDHYKGFIHAEIIKAVMAEREKMVLERHLHLY